jgi:broad specificity phosphatase PhoE
VLIIVRHGQTEWNARGLLLGRKDPELDPVGRTQAAALARVLEADRVVTSPLLRARQTAEAFARPTTVDERWIEIDYGALDGTPLADVPAALWMEWQDDVCFRPEGGESLVELGARVDAACDDLRDEASERDVVVVSHVSPVKAAAGWALGMGCEIAWRTFVAPASITRVGFSARGPVLRSFNETNHLESAQDGS